MVARFCNGDSYFRQIATCAHAVTTLPGYSMYHKESAYNNSGSRCHRSQVWQSLTRHRPAPLERSLSENKKLPIRSCQLLVNRQVSLDPNRKLPGGTIQVLIEGGPEPSEVAFGQSRTVPDTILSTRVPGSY